MRHFKTPQNTIRAIDTDQEALILPEWVELTEEQLATELEALKPVLTPEQLRDQALASLTHDFGDGRVIQIRPFPFSADESNIRNAIERMGRKSSALQPWRMADNSLAMMTKAELQQALESGQDQTAEIWEAFFSAVAAG